MNTLRKRLIHQPPFPLTRFTPAIPFSLLPYYLPRSPVSLWRKQKVNLTLSFSLFCGLHLPCLIFPRPPHIYDVLSSLFSSDPSILRSCCGPVKGSFSLLPLPCPIIEEAFFPEQANRSDAILPFPCPPFLQTHYDSFSFIPQFSCSNCPLSLSLQTTSCHQPLVSFRSPPRSR